GRFISPRSRFSFYLTAMVVAFSYTPLALVLIATPAAMYFLPEHGIGFFVKGRFFWRAIAALSGDCHFVILTSNAPRLSTLVLTPSQSGHGRRHVRQLRLATPRLPDELRR